MKYERPVIADMKIDMNKTDVLLGCQGWKDGITHASEVMYKASEIEELYFEGKSEDTFKIETGVVRRKIKGTNVIVPTKGSKKRATLYILNETASFIFDQVENGLNIGQIKNLITQNFKGYTSYANVNDIEIIISEFKKRNLIAN